LGNNFVAEIEEGLRDADLTVLFWSPDAAHSDWTRLEWTSGESRTNGARADHRAHTRRTGSR
jgi:hypothetical protein